MPRVLPLPHGSGASQLEQTKDPWSSRLRGPIPSSSARNSWNRVPFPAGWTLGSPVSVCACPRCRGRSQQLGIGKGCAWFWDGEGISSCSVELLQPLESLPLESLPLPGPSSAKPSPLRSHFATLEPGWFVQVILFGFSTLGRFPGTAKPKAKAEQEAGILARTGKSRDLGFFFPPSLAALPQLGLGSGLLSGWGWVCVAAPALPFFLLLMPTPPRAWGHIQPREPLVGIPHIPQMSLFLP